MTAPTLTGALCALGYTHRPAPAPGPGRREVLDATGAVVCTGTASEVWLWLHDRERELWTERAPGLLAAQTEEDPT